MTAIAIINRVYANEGAEAAAIRADLIGEGWAAKKIRAGEWNTQPVAETNIRLGHKGDVALHAVKRDGKIVRIVKSIRGESGQIVSAEPLDTTNIAEAMKVLL
jgi:hypothetical protein